MKLEVGLNTTAITTRYTLFGAFRISRQDHPANGGEVSTDALQFPRGQEVFPLLLITIV